MTSMYHFIMRVIKMGVFQENIIPRAVFFSQTIFVVETKCQELTLIFFSNRKLT